MITLYKQDGEILYGIKEFVLDSEDDIKDLPVHKVHIGSTALVIPTGNIYMLNGEKKWVVVGGSNSSGEGSATDCACEEILKEIDADGNNIIDSVELNEF